MVNTSHCFDWMVLSNYMERMKEAGYRETYQRNVLLNALPANNSKQRKDLVNKTTLYRPLGYRKVERREKRMKERDWAGQGFIAPIIISAPVRARTVGRTMSGMIKVLKFDNKTWSWLRNFRRWLMRRVTARSD